MKKTLIVALSLLSLNLFAQDMFTEAEAEVNKVSSKEEISQFWYKLYQADMVNASNEPGSLKNEVILLYKAAAMFNKHGYPDPKIIGLAKVSEDGYSQTYLGPWSAWRHCYNRDILDLTSPMITSGIKLNLVQYDNDMTIGSYIETAFGTPLQFNNVIFGRELKPINSTLEFLNTKGDKVNLPSLKVAILDFLKYWNNIDQLQTLESWSFKGVGEKDDKYKIVKSNSNQHILIKENVHGQTPIGSLTEKKGAYYLSTGPTEFFFQKVEGKMTLTDKHGSIFLQAI